MSNSDYSPLTESNSNPLKYVLIGDIDTSKIITEFQDKSAGPKSKKEINIIFNKICKNPNKKYEDRNKITSKNENYYFIIIKPNILYLVLATDSYPERYVFQLIDDINKAEIPTMVNEETNELNYQGKQKLKELIDKYQDEKNVNKIHEIQKDVENIKVDMKNNITKMVKSVEDVKELENKSEKLKEFSADFKENSITLRKETWWIKFKTWIILGGVVLLLLLIIILWVCL